MGCKWSHYSTSASDHKNWVLICSKYQITQRWTWCPHYFPTLSRPQILELQATQQINGLLIPIIETVSIYDPESATIAPSYVIDHYHPERKPECQLRVVCGKVFVQPNSTPAMLILIAMCLYGWEFTLTSRRIVDVRCSFIQEIHPRDASRSGKPSSVFVPTHELSY